METTNIVDVVSDFVALKHRGANYVACCPFHNEKTPSFYVSATKGIYKCFGCGKSGNAVTFLMEHEQMSYVEAIKYLGNKYGITVEEKEENPQERERLQKRESLLIVIDFAQNYFADALLNTKEGEDVGLSYFREREISDESIKEFALGYADASRDSFTKLALSKGYSKELLVETGLSKVSDSDSMYDGYRERVIFPIRNISGRVVAFGGRKLRSDSNLAKYINSPESLVYVKNKTLYGLFEAKKHIEKSDCCYLVEGYTDVISMAQKGVRNIVASCGTSLTHGQIELIKRFTRNIIVLYDGDSAGIHASLRGIDMFLAEGFNVKVLLLPDGEDPDSFAKSHTEEELKEFLNKNSEDFIAFKCRLSNSAELQGNPLKKAEFVKDISQSISVIPDAVLRNLFTSQVSQSLNIPLNALNDQVAMLRTQLLNEQTKQRRFRKAQSTEYEEYKNPQKLSAADYNFQVSLDSPLYKYERLIIYFLLKYGNELLYENVTASQLIKAHLDTDSLELENPSFRAIYNEYFTLEDKNPDQIIKHFSLKTGEDATISKLVIDIFDERYNIRSDKIKGSLIDERYLLDRQIPQTMYLYKAEVCGVRVNKMIGEMDSIIKSGDKERERQFMENIKELNSVRKELLKRAKEKK